MLIAVEVHSFVCVCFFFFKKKIQFALLHARTVEHRPLIVAASAVPDGQASTARVCVCVCVCLFERAPAHHSVAATAASATVSIRKSIHAEGRYATTRHDAI